MIAARVWNLGSGYTVLICGASKLPYCGTTVRLKFFRFLLLGQGLQLDLKKIYSEHLWSVCEVLPHSRGGRSHFFRLQLRSCSKTFSDRTPLLFQNFGIRIRQFFKFENPTLVQTPATTINPTSIFPCFYLRNDHTDSCSCRNWKVTLDPSTFFPKFLTPGPDPVRRKNAESYRSRLRLPESGPTSGGLVPCSARHVRCNSVWCELHYIL